MVENNWQTIWNKRKTDYDNLSVLDDKKIVLELKRLNGFDVSGSSLTYEAIAKEVDKTIEYLFTVHRRGGAAKSVFEVGCGSGVNLYLLHKAGFEVGGMDYSDALIKILRTVPTLENLRECICDEAINMPVDIKYDAVVSNRVCHYFYDFKYAEVVLKKMLQKANESIGILHIHDSEKETEFINFRRKLTPNYDERYKGLPNLFYSKNFFKNFAEKNNLQIEFTESFLDGFWNNPYIYNCFMYKA